MAATTTRRSAGAGRLGSVALALLATVPGTAAAHGFGQRYDLPVPLSLYLLGAGAAVLLSFVAASVFMRTGGEGRDYRRYDLLRTPVGRVLFSRPVRVLAETVSVALFLLIIVAGIAGSPNQTRNIAPLLVWVIWWVGVAYASALLGNVWPVINPWRILFGWAERLADRSNPSGGLSLGLPYPERLGVWPGVALFFTFAWIEIAFHDPARPSNVATLALIYSVITWTGMVLFGKDEWLRRGEAFTIVFGLLARFAPIEIRVSRSAGTDGANRDSVNHLGRFEAAPPGDREINLRPFAAGLLRTENVSTSMTAFVILLLSTVTFDGFTDTPTWASIVVGYYETFGSVNGVTTLGLLAFPIFFLAVYLLTCALMPRFAGEEVDLLRMARAFVLTLVPIALAYHLAHYLTYLLVQGQQLIPLASDPLGLGWNLFGTADYAVDINVVGARFAWYTAVIAIVVGHIVAVWLAHIVALRLFADHRAAVRSQYPMLVLMVAYTAISLWILAQPIVEAAPPV